MPQRVEGSIEVEAPVQQVYEYWKTLENLPHFMTNVEEVRSTGPDTTHWRVKGPLGASLEFDARTTQDETNEAIGWNTEELLGCAGRQGGRGRLQDRRQPPDHDAAGPAEL
jgi:uncharacterized membrane protein